MVWVKANGGPLALVVLGLTLAGVTTSYGWVFVGAGLVWWFAAMARRRLPWEVRRKPPSEPKEATQSWEELNAARVKRYQENRGLFLIHSWTRSSDPGQVADVMIRLIQHGPGPLEAGQIRAVEYTLGPKFTDHSLVRTDRKDGFAIDVAMYGPMLCLAKVFFSDGSQPLLLERYINLNDGADDVPSLPTVDFLLTHRLSVLRSELQHLHTLFTKARDAASDMELDAIEQVYQMQVEHSVRHELASAGNLLTRFWDDTGEPQPKGDDRKERVTGFLQRRHARLKEIIEELSSRL